jgi:hypothetical protein
MNELNDQELKEYCEEQAKRMLDDLGIESAPVVEDFSRTLKKYLELYRGLPF